MTTRILIDSSGLIAFVDRRAREHEAVVAIVDSPLYEITIPAVIVPETAYLIATRLGHAALRLFAADLALMSPRIDNLMPWITYAPQRS